MMRWKNGEAAKSFPFTASGEILQPTRSGWSGILLDMEMKADLFQRNVIYYHEDCLTSSGEVLSEF